MELKVGDNVIIKSWESMEQEYGLDRDGDIDCIGIFTRSMVKYCGTKMKITSINEIDSARNIVVYKMKNSSKFFYNDMFL